MFSFNNNSYFQFAPKEMIFQSEMPTCINLTDDNRTILVGTNIGLHYKIDLPEMKYRTVVQESDRFAIKSMTISNRDSRYVATDNKQP